MIRLRDGIEFQTEASLVIADARYTVGDFNIISHGHGDHIITHSDATVICSETTAALNEHRSGTELSFSTDAPGVTLYPAGHVLGSRAALIEDEMSYLYTGDVSTRDRFYMTGFEPIEADILVIETTYGRPEYVFPSIDTVVNDITAWIEENPDRPLVFFGYSLGRAQKLQYLLSDISDRPLYTTESIHQINQILAETTHLQLDTPIIESIDDLPGDALLVASSNRSGDQTYRCRIKAFDGLTAGVSGWAINESYRYWGDYDAIFPLSDHCDFQELVELVADVNPERVYTQHGATVEFAEYVTKHLGIDTYALERNQHTLDEY